VSWWSRCVDPAPKGYAWSLPLLHDRWVVACALLNIACRLLAGQNARAAGAMWKYLWSRALHPARVTAQSLGKLRATPCAADFARSCSL
jgi:hypothetical protein